MAEEILYDALECIFIGAALGSAAYLFVTEPLNWAMKKVEEYFPADRLTEEAQERAEIRDLADDMKIY